MTNPCNCKAEHWQPHADSCPQAKQNKGAAMTSDVLKILRGQRVDGRTVDEVMALAADELQALRAERHQLQNDLTAAGLENERLREVLTFPIITPEATSSALFIRTLREHEKGQPVNGQDLINALMWRVRNQRQEIARLQAKRDAVEPNAARLLVAKQAEDEGLWIKAQTVTEAYLQQELRKLHAAVEGTEKKSNVGTTYRGFPDGSCQECGEELGMHICPAGAEEKAGNVR